MATIDVKDAAGDTQTVAKVVATGQAAEADSLPVVLPAAQVAAMATEATLADVKAAVETLAADPATATLQGTMATAIAALNTLLTSLDGKTTAVNTDAVAVTNLAQMGGVAIALGSGVRSTGTQRVTIATDDVLAQLPATIGSKADAASLATTNSTEDKAAIGALTETAPASDTASSGLNGRLQRIAQRLTSLIGLLPSALGPQAGASSLSTVEAVPTTVTIVSLQTNATGSTYTAFGSQACEMLDIVNTAPAAVDLEVRRGSSGNTIIVPAGSSRMFVGLSNASGLEVRRYDQSNTQVTITAEAIKA